MDAAVAWVSGRIWHPEDVATRRPWGLRTRAPTLVSFRSKSTSQFYISLSPVHSFDN
jgi:hypothetical protein